MKKLLLIGTLLAVSGCSTTPVRIHNYRRVAVLDSSTSDESKQAQDKLAGQMISGITNRKYYKVMERERVQDLLDERQYHSLKEGNKESILET
ncbi:MAG: hypothetical protein U9R36_03825, partial [Elusimicrobiota bacterium]|nr:hypothetical protein [Elusimicrobiota bacterium]